LILFFPQKQNPIVGCAPRTISVDSIGAWNAPYSLFFPGFPIIELPGNDVQHQTVGKTPLTSKENSRGAP